LPVCRAKDSTERRQASKRDLLAVDGRSIHKRYWTGARVVGDFQMADFDELDASFRVPGASVTLPELSGRTNLGIPL
jgi:hypothetical protein